MYTASLCHCTTVYCCRYQDIWVFYKKSLASFWTVDEVDLSHDKQHWDRLNSKCLIYVQYIQFNWAMHSSFLLEVHLTVLCPFQFEGKPSLFTEVGNVSLSFPLPLSMQYTSEGKQCLKYMQFMTAVSRDIGICTGSKYWAGHSHVRST